MLPGQDDDAQEAPLREGDRIGPYRLSRALGRGGFAPVYLACEVHEGKKLRDVALKMFFRPSGVDPASAEASEWREGVLSEARALCRVQHPSVVRFYSVHRDKLGDALGLAMEYVGGESLEGRMQRLGRLGDQEVLDAATQVAWALSAVHAAGLVHRDVKPANIVCGPFGYKLIDFGVVADLDPSRKEHTEEEARRFIVGTPGYIAPECLYRGAMPSPASDLYALGATIRKLFSGRLASAESTLAEAATMAADEATLAALIDPNTGESIAPRSAHPTHAPPAAHEREDVAALVERLLAPEPAARPQHADWVARELERMRAVGPDERAGVASLSEVSFSRPYRADPPGAEVGPALVRVPPLVGRDDALAVIDAALADVRAGRVQVVLVSGPLGVGRTRLLDAAAERAGLPGSRVLRAVCRPERQSLLRPLVRGAQALSSAHPGALSGLREALALALQHEVLREARAPGSELEVVETALSLAAADEPLCVVIDDLQWGDAYTLELVRRLCDRAAAEAGVRLLLLASFRHEPSPRAPLRALLSHLRARVHPSIRHISLSPLSVEDATRVARDVARLSPELEAALLRGSGHVPFFLVNGVFAWRATGAIFFRDGLYRPADDDVVAVDLPGAAELLQARFSRAFAPKSDAGRLAARALAAVALHGGVLEAEVLAEVLGADVGAELGALVRAGLLVEMAEGLREVGFPEEMSRQAALNVARARPWFVVVHRSLLDVVARRPSPDAAFLAFGYDKLGEASLAKEWFGKAMEEAAAAGLFAEAAAFGDRLAALLGDPRERAAVELEIVRGLVQGRLFEDARGRLARLEEEARAGRVAEDAATSLGRRILRLRVARGRRDGSIRDEALIADADAHGDPGLRAEARLAVAGLERGEGAFVIASEAIAITAFVNPAIEFVARVLRTELGYEASPPRLSSAVEDLERALAIAHETASVWQEIHIEGDLAVLEAELGNRAAAIERLRKLARAAEARGMHGDRVRFSQNLAALLLRDGNAREAAEAAAEVTRLACEVGDPVLGSNAWSLRADALRRLGELDAALLSIDEAIRLQSQRGDRMEALSLLRRAEILVASNRAEEAHADAVRANNVAKQQGELWLARAADLWLVLDRAPHGMAGPSEVGGALESLIAAGNTRGAFIKALIERARAFLRPPDA